VWQGDGLRPPISSRRLATDKRPIIIDGASEPEAVVREILVRLGGSL
jgi:hypothetical protein